MESAELLNRLQDASHVGPSRFPESFGLENDGRNAERRSLHEGLCHIANLPHCREHIVKGLGGSKHRASQPESSLETIANRGKAFSGPPDDWAGLNEASDNSGPTFSPSKRIHGSYGSSPQPLCCWRFSPSGGGGAAAAAAAELETLKHPSSQYFYPNFPDPFGRKFSCATLLAPNKPGRELFGG